MQSGRRRARQWIGALENQSIRALAQSASMLPLHVVAQFKNDFQPVGRLDYADSTILMGVGSAMDHYRLTSCAKEPETIAWLQRSLRPDDVFFDVGANIGAYSLVADAIGAGRVRSFAFEPSFATFAQLSRNIFLNGASKRIVPLCVALTDHTGLLSFRYSDFSSGAARHNLEASEVAGEQFVLAISLDELLSRFGLPTPSVLKIDVDGGEAAALKGAALTLKAQRLRTVLVEFDDTLDETRTLCALLEQSGFQMSAKHRRYDSTYYNYIFLRD